ncbi:esterase-like activity of phytase family protein [Larsenimonas salina]|uniref:esterase-like activity of phytase family protein n=1 Tax=Larsenimonas salina TaxID=1295565 RepID=UPI002073D029|nr:esterase-like activity of phytase family protein [Larsenimonas salina]MCM5705290.1 esterase-like activity of phytase family protein [Larsenimonas salina]
MAGPVSMGQAGEGPSENVHWCGTLNLPGETPQGDTLGGISDLAFDAQTKTLYLLSDRARLYWGTLTFEGDTLRDLTIQGSTRLTDPRGRILKSSAGDSEGMTLTHDTQGRKRLLIGLELDDRLQYFTLTGRAVGAPLRPEALEGVRYNGGLEAVGTLEDGTIIAGLERPPRGAPAKTTRLFDLHGHTWHYELAEPSQSSLTALAPLGEGILTLERAFDPPRPLAISLRYARLGSSNHADVSTLATLYSSDGWLLDNFEGLTRLRPGRYLMVSDDNFNLIQHTLLSCMDITLPHKKTPQ